MRKVGSTSIVAVDACTPFHDLPEQLTISEYTAVTRLSRCTAYNQVRTGAVPFVKYGRSIRIPKIALVSSAK